MRLLTSQASVAASDSMAVQADHRREPRYAVVAIMGTASVQLQGRIDGGAPWLVLGEPFTATGVQSVHLMPEVRFNVTAVSGTVDAWIDAL